MKVALLGPNGQLGSDICAAAEKAGKTIQLVPLNRARLDVAETGAVRRQLAGMEFDALINCTSYHKTDEVEDNATLAFAVNAHAVREMALACDARKAQFIHFSTDFVFGGDRARDKPLCEDAPTAPVNVYGASKIMGEALARLACGNTVIVRVASLFGVAGSSGKGGNFVETIIRMGREKGKLSVVDDQIMSPTATADIAGVVMGMLNEGCPPGIYNVVNSGRASWFDLAAEIVRRAGIDAAVSPCPSEDYPTRAERPRYSVLDNGKASRFFGPMQTWQDALGRYLKAKGHVRGG